MDDHMAQKLRHRSGTTPQYKRRRRLLAAPMCLFILCCSLLVVVNASHVQKTRQSEGSSYYNPFDWLFSGAKTRSEGGRATNVNEVGTGYYTYQQTEREEEERVNTNLAGVLCPFNCSNNGSCRSQTGTCACYASFGGETCQYEYEQVSNNQIVNVTNPLTAGSWMYIGFQEPGSRNHFVVTASDINPPQVGSRVIGLYALLSPNGKNDVSWPRTDLYNASTTSIMDAGSELQLHVVKPASGWWIVGLHNGGSNQFTFSIEVSSYNLCPNNCSSNPEHGVCDQGSAVCKCTADYKTYPDCSTYIAWIKNNEIVNATQNIATDPWKYYQITVPANSNYLSINLTDIIGSSSTTSNLTLYAQANAQPTLFIYAYANTNLPQTTKQLKIDLPDSGTWFIGVYAATTLSNGIASYLLQANVSVMCPNQCSGWGTCNQQTGQCQCMSSHTLPDCSQLQAVLNEDQQRNDAINPGQWAFYNYSALAHENVNIIVTLTNLNLNPAVQLLARIGAYPDFYHYVGQWTGATNATVQTLTFDPLPINVTYYIGVYGVSSANSSSLKLKSTPTTSLFPAALDDAPFTTSATTTAVAAATPITYSIVAQSTLDCPNNCSGNGVCLPTGVCACSTNWTAKGDCSQFNVVMTNGGLYNFTIAPGDTHYYQIYVVSANQLLFDANRTRPGQIELYAQFEAPPTPFSYAARSNTSDEFHRVALTALTADEMGMWYAAVYNPGNVTTSYLMQGFSLRICPNECSGNGQCSGGICYCIPTYALYDCSSQDLKIFPSVEASGVVLAAQWNYYHINIATPTAVHIRVYERSTVGKVWVYMIKSDDGTVLPSQNVHLYANKSNTQEHDILISSVNATGTWYIGCFGSPYLGFNEPQAQYTIVALLGCSDYKHCGECTIDPNCGWCASNPLNPDTGFCTAGTDSKPDHSKCQAWLFSQCSVSSLQTDIAIQGAIAGLTIGGCVIILLLVSAVILYTRQTWFMEKLTYSPFDVMVISDDEDNAQDHYLGRSQDGGESEYTGASQSSFSSFFRTLRIGGRPKRQGSSDGEDNNYQQPPDIPPLDQGFLSPSDVMRASKPINRPERRERQPPSRQSTADYDSNSEEESDTYWPGPGSGGFTTRSRLSTDRRLEASIGEEEPSDREGGSTSTKMKPPSIPRADPSTILRGHATDYGTTTTITTTTTTTAPSSVASSAATTPAQSPRPGRLLGAPSRWFAGLRGIGGTSDTSTPSSPQGSRRQQPPITSAYESIDAGYHSS